MLYKIANFHCRQCLQSHGEPRRHLLAQDSGCIHSGPKESHRCREGSADHRVGVPIRLGGRRRQFHQGQHKMPADMRVSQMHLATASMCAWSCADVEDLAQKCKKSIAVLEQLMHVKSIQIVHQPLYETCSTYCFHDPCTVFHRTRATGTDLRCNMLIATGGKHWQDAGLSQLLSKENGWREAS